MAERLTAEELLALSKEEREAAVRADLSLMQVLREHYMSRLGKQ